MRNVTVYGIGKREQLVAGPFLQVAEAAMNGLLPHGSLQRVGAVDYTVHDLPIFTVVDETGEAHHFAVMPEVWDKLQGAVRSELAQTKADLARTEQRLIAALDRLDGFRACTRWRRLVAAWKGDL